MFGGVGILPVIQHIPSGGHLDPQKAEKDRHGPLRGMTPMRHGVRSFNLHVPSFPPLSSCSGGLTRTGAGEILFLVGTGHQAGPGVPSARE